MSKEILVFATVKQVYNRLTGGMDSVVRVIGKIIILPDGTIEFISRQS